MEHIDNTAALGGKHGRSMISNQLRHQQHIKTRKKRVHIIVKGIKSVEKYKTAEKQQLPTTAIHSGKLEGPTISYISDNINNAFQTNLHTEHQTELRSTY